MAEGVELIEHTSRTAVMGWIEVLWRVPFFIHLQRRLIREVKSRDPKLCVLIDFSSFHLRLAQKLTAEGYKVVYYVPPKTWASGLNRVATLRQNCDLVCGILPFEADFFHRHRVPYITTQFPHASRLNKIVNTTERHRDLTQHRIIAILPGSRSSEIRRMARPLARCMDEIRSLAQIGGTEVTFYIPVGSSLSLSQLRDLMPRGHKKLTQWPDQLDQLNNHEYIDCGDVRFFKGGQGARVLHLSDGAVITSGTASLESALVGTPHCVVYKLHPLSYRYFKKRVSLPYISLVNLSLNRMAAREYIQQLPIKKIAQNVWLLSGGALRNDPTCGDLPNDDLPDHPSPDYLTWQRDCRELQNMYLRTDHSSSASSSPTPSASSSPPESPSRPHASALLWDLYLSSKRPTDLSPNRDHHSLSTSRSQGPQAQKTNTPGPDYNIPYYLPLFCPTGGPCSSSRSRSRSRSGSSSSSHIDHLRSLRRWLRCLYSLGYRSQNIAQVITWPLMVVPRIATNLGFKALQWFQYRLWGPLTELIISLQAPRLLLPTLRSTPYTLPGKVIALGSLTSYTYQHRGVVAALATTIKKNGFQVVVITPSEKNKLTPCDAGFIIAEGPDRGTLVQTQLGRRGLFNRLNRYWPQRIRFNTGSRAHSEEHPKNSMLESSAAWISHHSNVDTIFGRHPLTAARYYLSQRSAPDYWVLDAELNTPDIHKDFSAVIFDATENLLAPPPSFWPRRPAPWIKSKLFNSSVITRTNLSRVWGVWHERPTVYLQEDVLGFFRVQPSPRHPPHLRSTTERFSLPSSASASTCPWDYSFTPVHAHDYIGQICALVTSRNFSFFSHTHECLKTHGFTAHHQRIIADHRSVRSTDLRALKSISPPPSTLIIDPQLYFSCRTLCHAYFDHVIVIQVKVITEAEGWSVIDPALK